MAVRGPSGRGGPHAASAHRTIPPQPAVLAIRPAPGPLRTDDTSLADWPDKAGTRLPWFRVPAPYVPFGDVHLTWRPEGLALFHLAQNYVDLGMPCLGMKSRAVNWTGASTLTWMVTNGSSGSKVRN